MSRCHVCGQLLEQKKTGRPRIYHDDCKRLNELLSWTEDQVFKIDFINRHYSQMIRSRLFQIANQLSGGTL